jgi:hypothetical protein
MRGRFPNLSRSGLKVGEKGTSGRDQQSICGFCRQTVRDSDALHCESRHCKDTYHSNCVKSTVSELKRLFPELEKEIIFCPCCMLRRATGINSVTFLQKPPEDVADILQW